MNRLADIRKMKTLIPIEEVRKCANSSCTGIHQSVTKAFHILELTKEYLSKGVTSDVMLEIIKDLEDGNYDN